MAWRHCMTSRVGAATPVREGQNHAEDIVLGKLALAMLICDAILPRGLSRHNESERQESMKSYIHRASQGLIGVGVSAGESVGYSLAIH